MSFSGVEENKELRHILIIHNPNVISLYQFRRPVVMEMNI